MAINESTLVNAGLQLGLFDTELVARLRPVARAQRLSLPEAIAVQLRLPLAAMWHALAESRGMPFVRLAEVDIAEELLERVPASLLQAQRILPVRSATGELLLVTGDPDERSGPASVARLLGSPAVQALRLGGQQFPVLRVPSVVDADPQMQPANKDWSAWRDKFKRER